MPVFSMKSNKIVFGGTNMIVTIAMFKERSDKRINLNLVSKLIRKKLKNK